MIVATAAATAAAAPADDDDHDSGSESPDALCTSDRGANKRNPALPSLLRSSLSVSQSEGEGEEDFFSFTIVVGLSEVNFVLVFASSQRSSLLSGCGNRLLHLRVAAQGSQVDKQVGRRLQSGSRGGQRGNSLNSLSYCGWLSFGGQAGGGWTVAGEAHFGVSCNYSKRLMASVIRLRPASAGRATHPPAS